jgi:hypothetical protein
VRRAVTPRIIIIIPVGTDIITEELAELHAIIQAIEYERRNEAADS